MESHKCNLCSTLFINARALGSHMKLHHPAAAAPPLPPPTSSSAAAAANDLDSDPVFDSVDRESETESKNPTRKRSKRRRKQPPEPASSVSDTSPEEDLAMCLMMLSRDGRIENQNQNEIRNQELEGNRGKKKCENCKKQFRSYRALFSHGNVCQLKTEVEESCRNGGNRRRRRMFKCPFCLKVFGSGQALGGHKRSHLVSSTNGSVSFKLGINLIDLNLPPPLQHDISL